MTPVVVTFPDGRTGRVFGADHFRIAFETEEDVRRNEQILQVLQEKEGMVEIEALPVHGVFETYGVALVASHPVGELNGLKMSREARLFCTVVASMRQVAAMLEEDGFVEEGSCFQIYTGDGPMNSDAIISTFEAWVARILPTAPLKSVLLRVLRGPV